jgi:hypothetical protein
MIIHFKVSSDTFLGTLCGKGRFLTDDWNKVTCKHCLAYHRKALKQAAGLKPYI